MPLVFRSLFVGQAPVYTDRNARLALENFNSQRIGIMETFYRDNDRLLEGGIWAEITVARRSWTSPTAALVPP